MKKIILLFTVLISISLNSYAQNADYREDLIFGLKVGANYSNVYDTKGEQFNADGKLGLAGGAFLSIPLGEFFGVQPEVLLSQKGFRGKGVLFGLPYDVTRTTTYLDIPLLFSIKPSSHLSIVAGPQYSYLINQRDVFANGITTIEQEQEFENENIRRNILCFIGGIDLNANHVVVSARMGWDILHNNGDGSSTTPRYKNVWYQLTVGYRFHN